MTSPGDDLAKKTKDLKIKDDTFINILLLGETGVGKSTFINSIANYLTHNDFKTAEKENLIKLIPSKCKVQDKHGEYHIIQIGSEEDQNECLDVGMSATQDVKSYVFPIWNGTVRVRLIDTPGIGDVRGIHQDNINCENILSYIGQLHELHAICYLFKPTNPRITVFLDYCINQILSRLDKSASKNIIFIFTNTRGTDYGPGESYPILEEVIRGIKSRPPHVDIPLNKNIFCFDNEAFRFLAAIKQKIEFDNSIKQRNYESWKRSVEQCNNLIKYIVGDTNRPPLKPHFIKSTSAINEARRLVTQLSQPLAEISQLISDNLNALHWHTEDLNLNSSTLDELKKKLYMPVIDLEVTKLTQPVTVCASRKCAEIYKVGEMHKWHYKQKCHDPCYLTNVPKEIIGSPELINCAAINSSSKTCTKCYCDFSAHMHVYYFTKTVDSKTVDRNIKHNIDSKEKLLENARKLIDDISRKKDELQREHEIIVRTCAKFAHFLQNNAITPFSDSYKEYIEYMIVRERSLGILSKMSVIHQLQNLLREYEAAKQSFDEALALQKRIGETDALITPQKIQDSIQELYNLKHNGKKIKELYECQKKSRAKEHKHTEYVHQVLTRLEKDSKKESKEDKELNTSHQKKQVNKSADGNQKNTQQRGRGQSQTRNRARNPSPPPAYQDVPPTRQDNPPYGPGYNYQGHSRPYRPHDYPGPQYHPHNYPGPGPQYHRPGPWTDYRHLGNSGNYHPGYSGNYHPGYPGYDSYREPPVPGPDYRNYDRNAYGPRYDGRDIPVRDRSGNESDNYEIRVTVNKPQESQGTSSANIPPPQPFPPRDPYRQDFPPPNRPYPPYQEPQHFGGRPYDNYQGQNRNIPRPYQNQRFPQNRSHNNNNYRGRGGFRGGMGQKTAAQKFKNVSRKKKNTNADSNASDSNSD